MSVAVQMREGAQRAASITGAITAARSGDRAAFGTLYEQYGRLVHGVLLAYVPFADAEDLSQEVFLKAMERLHTLRDDDTLGGWLATIARNLAKDSLRRSKRWVPLLRDLWTGPACDPEAGRALAAIRRLPECYRETLTLRFVEGMTGPEIAERTGLSHDSVRVNLHRGMKLLKSEFLGDKNHA